MKRLYAPLLFLLVLWSIILLVPPLRSWCRLQIRGDVMMPFSALPPRTHDPNFWHHAAKRFPEDINIWVQAVEESGDPAQANDRQSSNVLIDVGILKPQAKPSILFPGQPKADFQLERLRRYDLLIKKYPQNTWLLARRLRLTLSTYKANRMGGELSDNDIVKNVRAGKPSPERNNNKLNFSPAELQETIKLCQQGQKLEPNNTFYDWSLCYFASIGWQDRVAWQALDSGARKTTWNTHETEDVQEEISAYEKVLGRNLLWEEKLSSLFLGLYSIGRYTSYRGMGRIIAWEGIKAKRRGDHAQALRLWGNMVLITRWMREGSITITDSLMATAVQPLGYSYITYDSKIYLYSTTRKRLSPRQRVDNFKQYARLHGRNDLAQEIEMEWKRATAFNTWTRSLISRDNLYGTPFKDVTFMAILWRSGVYVLLMLPLSIIAWLLISLILRTPRVRHLLQTDALSSERLSPSELIGNVLACSSLRALCSTSLTVSVFAFSLFLFLTTIGQTQEISSSLKTWWSENIGSELLTNSPVEALAYSLVGFVKLPTSVRWLLALLPAFLGVLHASWKALEKQKQQNGEHAPGWAQYSLALLNVRIFRGGFQLNLAHFCMQFFDWVLSTAFIVAWVLFSFSFFVPEADWSGDWKFISLIVMAICGAGLVLTRFWRWWRRPRRRAAIRYTLNLWRAGLAAWFLLGCLVYVLSLLAMLPVRTQADRTLENYIRYGEIKAAQIK